MSVILYYTCIPFPQTSYFGKFVNTPPHKKKQLKNDKNTPKHNDVQNRPQRKFIMLQKYVWKSLITLNEELC